MLPSFRLVKYYLNAINIYIALCHFTMVSLWRMASMDAKAGILLSIALAVFLSPITSVNIFEPIVTGEEAVLSVSLHNTLEDSDLEDVSVRAFFMDSSHGFLSTVADTIKDGAVVNARLIGTESYEPGAYTVMLTAYGRDEDGHPFRERKFREIEVSDAAEPFLIHPSVAEAFPARVPEIAE